ncbi:hypothetical protein PENTCL1PPCAC_20183, partial [Pristionchus entomophagus]
VGNNYAHSVPLTIKLDTNHQTETILLPLDVKSSDEFTRDSNEVIIGVILAASHPMIYEQTNSTRKIVSAFNSMQKLEKKKTTQLQHKIRE